MSPLLSFCFLRADFLTRLVSRNWSVFLQVFFKALAAASAPKEAGILCVHLSPGFGVVVCPVTPTFLIV